MDLSTREGRQEQGRRIQTAAREAGLSLADVAKQIGCSRALIYQYVSGQVLAQPDRLQAIANLCGRPLAWFYAAEGEAIPAAERDAELERLRAELEAEKLAFERSRGRELVEHLEILARAQASGPDFEALRRTCERLVERARDLADPTALAEAEYLLGDACYALGDYEATRAAMSCAIESFRALGLEGRERAARQTLGGALAGLGERDRALAEFEAVVAGGEFADEWRGRLGRADVYEALGRGEDALAELEAAEASVAAQPEGSERSWAELYLTAATVNVYLLHDDFAAAVERARTCLPLAEELSSVGQLVEARINVGYARRRLGEWPEALESLDDAVRLARLTGDRERHATAMACRAEVLATIGLHDRARAEGKDALAAALGIGSVRGELLAHLALSGAYRRTGDGHEALYHARQGVAGATSHGLTKLAATFRLELAAARRLLGDESAAVAEERRAGEVAEQIGARWLQGRAALGLAASALAADDRGSAAEQVSLAAGMSAETGEWELGFEARMLAAELAAAGGDLSAAAEQAEDAIRDLLGRRDALVSSGSAEGILEEEGRLTALRRCITLLLETGRRTAAVGLLDAAAWPPLVGEFEHLLEE